MSRFKQFCENTAKVVFFISALTSIASVALICIFLFSSSIPVIEQIGLFDFLGSAHWAPSDSPPSFGILAMVLGSLYVTVGALIVGVPIGIFSAVFMAYFCPKRLYKIIKPAIDLLAGIPSIIYGFIGLILLVPLIRELFGGTGTSILAASILLGIMILPTIIAVSESALRAVPQSYYEGARALGASHERAVFVCILPAANSGVIAAIALGLGRAIGETMAVIMVVGNQVRIPVDMLKGARTMTANIVLEMGYAAGEHRDALFATGAVLFVFILLINLGFSALRKKLQS